MGLITKYKVNLANNNNTKSEREILEKVNLEYLKENAPLIYLETCIYKALSQFLNKNSNECMDTLINAFSFVVVYRKFRKRYYNFCIKLI